MSSYVDKKEEIIYPDGSSTPSGGVYPSSYTGASGAAGGASALPTDPYGYAEYIRNSAYQNATDAANKARQDALLNKQNALVGADTAYRQGLATYGANAESLASKGLSGSGYAEYLTGKNYATARAEKAAANATYQGAMNDILYQENSAKQSADQVYADTMIKLKEKEQTDALAAYDALMNSAISGLDLGSIQADARWGSLSPDQQKAITSTVNEKALGTRIANGETIDSIMATEEWGGLSAGAQGNLQNAYNTKVRGERYENVLRDAEAGYYTTETITQIPDWNTFTEGERNALYDAARSGQETKSANASSNYATWLGAINRGEATIDDIRNLTGYSDLTPDQKTSLENASKTYKNNLYLSTKDDIIVNMTEENFENYTDEYLDDLITAGSLDEAGEAAIKDKRADAAFQSIINRITAEGGYEALSAKGGLNELVNVLNEMQEKNYLSHPEVMQLYDYAKDIAYSPYKNVSVSNEEEGVFKITFSDGSTANVTETRVSADTNYVLQNISNPKSDRVYQVGGRYYIKHGGKWYNINTTKIKNAMLSEEKEHVVTPQRNN